jgi:hypothetical protein
MSELRDRALRYIAALAEKRGVRYDLSENLLNRNLLVMLWDECNCESQNQERIKAICQELLEASIVGVVQETFYFPEPKPEVMEEIQTLFRHPFEFVKMGNTSLAKIVPRPVTLNVTVTGDDDEVMKLMPGVQLSLFDTAEAQ